MIKGNLLKHYKERHPGCDLPETLSDLDKAVTKGLSTTIPPHERGLILDISSKIAHDSYIRDIRLNDAEEQRNLNVSFGKSSVRKLHITTYYQITYLLIEITLGVFSPLLCLYINYKCRPQL